MTRVPASNLKLARLVTITMPMEVRLLKLVLSLIYLSNRSGAAAVAQRLVHELQRRGGCNNPGFESLAAVGDPHTTEGVTADRGSRAKCLK